MADAAATAGPSALVALATAVLTAPPAIAAVQAALSSWSRKRRSALVLELGTTVLHSVNFPQPPGFRGRAVPRWEEPAVRRKYWSTLRFVFALLSTIYTVVGGFLVWEGLRGVSQLLLLPAGVVLAYAALLVRQLVRLRPGLWQHAVPVSQEAELTISGTAAEVFSQVLSAATSNGGRLLRVDSQAAEVVVATDRSRTLTVRLDVPSSGLVRVQAIVASSRPSNLDNTSSQYRRLYSFLSALLARREAPASGS